MHWPRCVLQPADLAGLFDSHYLLGWVEQLEEIACLINYNESKFYSSILKSIKKHINHPFLGEFCLKLLGSPEDKVATAEAAWLKMRGQNGYATRRPGSSWTGQHMHPYHKLGGKYKTYGYKSNHMLWWSSQDT